MKKNLYFYKKLIINKNNKMYEKILQKLKTQRGQTSNVSDRSLEDLAKSLVTVITTDDQLEVADLTAAITSIDGNISHYTKTAVDKKIADDKKAADDKAAEDAKKKLAEDALKTKKKGEKTEEVPDYIKTLMEQNEKLNSRLDGMQADKVTSTRGESLKKSLEGLPEYYTKPVLTGFKNMNFGSDEEFDAYLTEAKSNGDAFTQAAKEQGLNTSIPSTDVKKPVENGQTTEISNAREVIQKENDKLNSKKD